MSRKKRKNLIVIALLLICVIGIGFAYLSTNLTISGTANISATTWDVHFENVNLTEGSVTTTAPTIGTDTVIASFETTLDEPGDFYEFTIDVVNEGTIDAMISELDLGTLTPDQEKYLNYSVTYSDGLSINKKDLLSSGSTETLKVRIEFKSDIDSSDLPTTGDTVKKNISITYVQNDGGVKVSNIGDYFKIGTEGFYVISNDGTNVKALAEWNLEVGNHCISDDSTSTYSCTAISNPSGLQSSSSLGYTSSGYNTIGNHGTLAFSTTNYWPSNDGETIDLTNSANNIYSYLTAYKTSLTNLGGNIIDIGLITKAELISLGCVVSSNSCIDAPSWVYQTTYWSGSAKGVTTIWRVISYGDFSNRTYNNEHSRGIRPVITVLASDIK